MAGTKLGGLKARDNILAKDPDHYRKIGSKGGLTPTISPKGFAAFTLEKRRATGTKGGLISRRKKNVKQEN